MSSEYWLVGVRKGELEARDGKRFFDELEDLYYASTTKDQRFGSPVWKVPAPIDIQPLQKKYGADFIEFFYITPALLKASEGHGLPINKLQLTFGTPPNAEIFSVVPIPLEFSEP